MAHGPFKQMVDGSILLSDLADIAPTAEAAMWPVADYSGVGPNVLRAGQKYAIEAYGVMDTPAASMGNITFTPRWGTTTGGISLGASVATALVASATNLPWKLTYNLEVRSIGLSGLNTVVVGNGVFQCAVGLVATGVIVFGTATTALIDAHASGGIFMGVTVGIATDLITVKSISMFTWNQDICNAVA